VLKFFFNKESKVMYAVEILGILCLLGLIITWWPSGKSTLSKIIFFIFFIEYLFIRFFASIKCYDDEGQKKFNLNIESLRLFPFGITYKGIELQLKKAMVPTSYILPLFCGLLLIGAPSWILYIGVLLLAVIIHVSIILLFFYIKDNEKLPVNYFTHNKYLKHL
jgi:hypothetical protein